MLILLNYYILYNNFYFYVTPQFQACDWCKKTINGWLPYKPDLNHTRHNAIQIYTFKHIDAHIYNQSTQLPIKFPN